MNAEILMVLDVLAKSLGVLLIAAALQLLWRKTSAAQRCLIWLAAFAVLLLLPLTAIMKPVWTVSVPDRNPAPPVLHELPNIQSLPMIPVYDSAPLPRPVAEPSWQMPKFSLWQWLGLAWLSGVTILLLRRVAGAWQLRRLYQRSFVDETPRISALASRLASEVGVRRRVDLRHSSEVTVPLTWGFFRPVLLLPADAAKWPESSLHAALCHELGHIRHWDALSRLLMSILCALQWPNALLWLAAKSWRTAQEQACDDLVLNSGASKEAYAMQLLESARSVQRFGFLHAALTMAQPSTLETRLSAIMDEKRDRRPMKHRMLLAGAVAALAVLGLCATLQVRAESKPELENTRPVQAWYQMRRIEIPTNVTLPADVASLLKPQPPAALDDQKLSRILDTLNTTFGVVITYYRDGIVMSGQERVDSVGRKEATDSEGKEQAFIGIQRHVQVTDNGTEMWLKTSVVDSDMGGSMNGHPALRVRTGHADQRLNSGESLLIPLSAGNYNGQADGKPSALFLIFTLRKAILTPNLGLSADRIEFSHPEKLHGKAIGHVRADVTQDGPSSDVLRGMADQVEFDLEKQQIILSGHPQEVFDKKRHLGTAVDSKMVVTWSSQEKPLFHGPFKTEVEPDRTATAGRNGVEPHRMGVGSAVQEAAAKEDWPQWPTTVKSLHSMDELDDMAPLAIGDCLSFQIVQDRQRVSKIRIPSSGTNYIPYLGEMKLAGMTARKAANAVKADLEKNHYFKEATVLIAVEYLPPRGYFTVRGEVRMHGRFEIGEFELPTLEQALARAGGLTGRADRDHIHVRAKAASTANTGDTGHEFTVKYGDIATPGKSWNGFLIFPGTDIVVDKSDSVKESSAPPEGHPKNGEGSALADADVVPARTTAQKKADHIIIPTVLFKEATVDEALEFLRVRAKELDPAKEGVNILLSVGPKSPAREARLTMDLKNIPLAEALRYVAELTNLELTADEKSMILRERTPAQPKPALQAGAAAPAQVRYYTVFGQVKQQGKFEIAPGESVLLSMALQRAGGLTAFGNSRKIHIVRKTPEGNKTININYNEVLKHGAAENDIPIEPNDVIIIDEKVINF